MTGLTWPDLEEVLAGALVVSIPLRVPFRGVRHREAVLVRGPLGWGEFAPFLEYSDREAVPWLRAAVEAGWGCAPRPLREQVEVNATVPAVRAEQVPAVLDAFDGCRTAKVKVAQSGQDLRDDLARVSAVRSLMGPGAAIRIDANGAWDLEQAVDAITALAAFDLEYAEQPVAKVDDLARLRRRLARAGVDVPIAADESIRRADDPMEVARLGAADLIVVKVAPLGGVNAALEVVQHTQLPAVVSSALDTSVGIAAGVTLACALPDLPYACGLGTAALLRSDVTRLPLVPVNGALTVSRAAEAIASVDPAVHALAATDRAVVWRDRLRRCWALLSATDVTAQH